MKAIIVSACMLHYCALQHSMPTTICPAQRTVCWVCNTVRVCFRPDCSLILFRSSHVLGSSKLAQAHPTMYCSVLLVVKWILKVNGVGLDFPLSPPNVDISKPICEWKYSVPWEQSLQTFLDKIVSTGKVLVHVRYLKRYCYLHTRRKLLTKDLSPCCKGCVCGLGGLQAFLEGYSTLET